MNSPEIIGPNKPIPVLEPKPAPPSPDVVNPALTGATKAFGKPPIKPKPQAVKLQQQSSGALDAATASWGKPSPSPRPSPSSTATQSKPPALPPRIQSNVLPPPLLAPTPVRPPRTPYGELRPRALPPPPLPVRNSTPEIRQTLNHHVTKQEDILETREVPKVPPPRRPVGRNGTASVQVDGQVAASSAAALASKPHGLEPGSRVASVSRREVPPQPPRRVERYQDQSMKLLTPHVTGTLANAILGANLAASRSPTRQSTPNTPPGRPRGRSPQHNGTGNMRQTLRSQEPADPSSEYDKRFRLPRHPHKHHEGDRKRWQEKVQEDEYRDYAGVWAACKGWLLTKPSRLSNRPSNVDPDGTMVNLDDEVSNVICKELWDRSKLPSSVLADIYDLVDSRGVCRLTKDQFIVGMWLITRQLEGRKMPSKVADSVWASVKLFGGVSGVKIRID
jgi:hypothetical protein